jgi:hypothetical protein
MSKAILDGSNSFVGRVTEPLKMRTRPRHGRRAEAARVKTAWQGAHAGPVEALALGFESGCFFAAISIGLLQALVLSLGIADGFCQHLA